MNLLGNDSHTLQQLTANSDNVTTALADNSQKIKRFIVDADNAASDTAVQDVNLQSTLQKLPGFPLSQLRPALQRGCGIGDSGEHAGAEQPERVIRRDRPPVHRPAGLLGGVAPGDPVPRPSVGDRGRRGHRGEADGHGAEPALPRRPPTFAQNLAIVTHVLDDRKYAVEKNSRSPGGQGYTGLEALLQFVFNLAGATNYYGPFGHELGVDAFVISGMCTPYATQGTIESNLKLFGPAARSCYAWLGPNQPGVNETDPTNPTGCVPDPGGAPPGETGLGDERRGVRLDAGARARHPSVRPDDDHAGHVPDPEPGRDRSRSAGNDEQPADGFRRLGRLGLGQSGHRPRRAPQRPARWR